MLLERIVSEGLAHYSYLIGDRNLALAIDPRRDVDDYIKLAAESGMRIAHVLETHRNEDYFTGSMELASRTGAEVWHADGQWDYQYGQAVTAGQRWKLGRLEIEAVSTPGHTPGSMSYLLRDPAGVAWMLFCGDALFAGDVGRIDLMGSDQSAENAGLLFESIFSRILPLGDEVILCPAHGSGSVCGESIAERIWTSIGIEKKHNSRLQAKSREQFVASLLTSQLGRPPYFRRMEKVNLEGRPLLGALPSPRPLGARSFLDLSLSQNALVLDTRQELAFSAAHVPGSQSIWQEGLASFAGWFLSYNRTILLVGEGNQFDRVAAILLRLGFDDIAGFLAGGMLSWHMSGLESASIRTQTVQDLCHTLDDGEKQWILDVRFEGELEKDGRIEGAQHIPITAIAERMQEVPMDRDVAIFCGSGMRSMVAASYLKARGWKRLSVVLGGMAGWRSIKCPISRTSGDQAVSSGSGS
ncbi:MAG: MBL fold metallo-hydrolase [Methanothrix sp.]|nr:MBL fold metallo-hydrolase [Methanothrix sp.]